MRLPINDANQPANALGVKDLYVVFAVVGKAENERFLHLDARVFEPVVRLSLAEPHAPGVMRSF